MIRVRQFPPGAGMLDLNCDFCGEKQIADAGGFAERQKRAVEGMGWRVLGASPDGAGRAVGCKAACPKCAATKGNGKETER